MVSLIQGYTYDIFISYRQKDNKYDGWVTEFVDNLKRELESMFKDEVSVYFDINPHDGLLETHDVDASLKDKLRCLICIPIISRTYCDPKAFAWEHEFKVFIEQASHDKYGLKIKLPNGNVANRVLPVRIHDLDPADIKLFESVVGGMIRSIDFVYKETGVNRQLRAKDDDIIKSSGQILYRDQINKVALATKDIIESMKMATEEYHVTNEEIIGGETSKREGIETSTKDSITASKPESDDISSKIEPKGSRNFSQFVKSKIFLIGILPFIVVALLLTFNVSLNSRIKRSREVILPQVEQNIREGKYNEAFDLLTKVEKYVSDNPEYKRLSLLVSAKVNIITNPPGCEVEIKPYAYKNAEWTTLGKTPLDSIKLPANTYFIVRMHKQDYNEALSVWTTIYDTCYRTLFKSGSMPEGMVYIEGCNKSNVLLKEGFYIDRYEVTNKQYKEFVDDKGYRDRKFWKNDFIKDGKLLHWEQAMKEFIDKTGRPGPSTWEKGDYPVGQDNYPVSGISWYEAAAYAEFKGKNLPTYFHWINAAGFYDYWYINFTAQIGPASNFKNQGPEPVGQNTGINRFGAYDMAGNIREWGWNKTKNGNIIGGGGWDDPYYMYVQASQLPPFDRSAMNGFRCIKIIDTEKIPENVFNEVKLLTTRDFYKEKPVKDDIFKIYKNQFLYDKSNLEERIEYRDETPEDWIIEKISFNASYGNERVIAYLFLPKYVSSPYQTMIYFPSSDALSVKDLLSYPSTRYTIDYYLKSGRAVLYPVYKGTFERQDAHKRVINYPNLSHDYTDYLIMWVKDFRRSVDYLETRKDIDLNKLGYYGVSFGGAMGGIIPAIEERIKLSILIVGGFQCFGVDGRAFPEADALNYVSRIKSPVLMLNGKYDPIFPYETTVKPFYDLLGTPTKDKRMCLFETDHLIHNSNVIKESLNWVDKYFGPVK